MEPQDKPQEETRPVSSKDKAIDEAEREAAKRSKEGRREADEFYNDGHR